VGELLGGYRAPDDLQELLPWQKNPNAEAVGIKQQTPKESDTRELLESNIVLGPPRPWGALPDKGIFQKGDVPNGLRASLGFAPPFALPTEALREQEVATARLAARLAACERRMDVQEAKVAVEETEPFQRLSIECRQLKDSMLTSAKLSDERFAILENAQERTRREETAVREQTVLLQNDFREFAGTAVSRQRAEIESVVTRAFSQQNAANEEWRNAMRQRDAQLQSEVQRVSHAMEDVGHQLVSTQAELRTRLAALETARLTGRAPGNVSDGAMLADVAGGHMVDFLKQQMDALRQHVEQSAARIAELTARCDGDVAAQRALKQENDTRLAALGKAIAAERDNLSQRLLQRLEVLESRLGVERSEQAAKQAEIRDQVTTGDYQGSMQLQDLASKMRMEFEALERRLQSEMTALNGQVEAEFAQLRSSKASEEDVHRQSMASMLHRLESGNERQTEAISNLRKELDLSLKEVRESLSRECVVRAEEDRKLATEATRTTHSVANDLTAIQRYVQKQAESVAGELERMRWTNTDRADKLSRYVDDKVANSSSGPSVSKFDSEAEALIERISTLKSSLEEQGRVAEKRVESFAEDFRARLQKVEEAWMREATSVRRDAERNTIAAERRTVTAQGELKARFESYVKHFDAAISSVQTAILRPLPGDGADIAPRPLPLSPTPPATKAQVGSTARRSIAAKMMPHDVPQDIIIWQNEELQCIVDGLRMHKEPDLASQVIGSLSRGESVVVKSMIVSVGRRWACLTKGGFVLAFSEGGTPLLQQLPRAESHAPDVTPISAELQTQKSDAKSEEEITLEEAVDLDEMEQQRRVAEDVAYLLEEERQIREVAAARIQAVRRGRLARQQVLPQLQQRDSAIKKLQAAERGRQVRKELRPLRLIRDQKSFDEQARLEDAVQDAIPRESDDRQMQVDSLASDVAANLCGMELSISSVEEPQPSDEEDMRTLRELELAD